MKDFRDQARREAACESLICALLQGTHTDAVVAMDVFSMADLDPNERELVASAIRTAIGREDLFLEELGVSVLAAIEGDRALPDLLRGLESRCSGAIVQSIMEIQKLGNAAQVAVPILERLQRVGSSRRRHMLSPQVIAQIEELARIALGRIRGSG